MSINITNEDNMELMKRYEDNYFDLAIVDPPYGIGAGGESFKNGTSKNKTIGFKKKDWDLKRPSLEYFLELKRVSKNQIIWGGNYFADLLDAKMCWIFWDKGTGDNSYADGELAWTSFNKALRKYKVSWVGANANNGTPRIHPTEKPIQLYEWLLMNYAKEGDKILDTHLGSGSIAIACHNLGYELTACELDTEYYNNAIKRLKQHQAQQRLFV
jgi:site-specific DNA-methyltransferase (adenine-specific)